MQGTLKDAVYCRECKSTRFREDQFMDLSLVIRPFGSQELMGSIEAAIDFFVRPEVLNEGNQVGHTIESLNHSFPLILFVRAHFCDIAVSWRVSVAASQVMCDVCAKKTDAEKGLRLHTLPTLLMLQLKRFDFDMVSLRRVKLNDKVQRRRRGDAGSRRVLREMIVRPACR
jgi:ubiquitin carboxyl-terminal hydrolase 47